MAGTAMKIRWVLRHNPQNRLLPPKYYAAPVLPVGGMPGR